MTNPERALSPAGGRGYSRKGGQTRRGRRAGSVIAGFEDGGRGL